MELEQLVVFYNTYGLQVALIALFGIILLGVLKYTNVFSKIEKSKRKPIYLAISVGFSVAETAVYLLIIKQFDLNYLITVAPAMFALNQTMYAVFETTGLRELVVKVLDFITKKAKGETKPEEKTE